MYTEEEARKLWCPMVRLPIYGNEDDKSPASCNKYDDGDIGRSLYCMASDCMMWRWEGRGSGATGKGYCGLGGKP